MASCKPPISRLAHPDFNSKFPNQFRNSGLIRRPARSGLPYSLCEGGLFFRYAEQLFHHRLLVSKQGINLGIAPPGPLVGLGIIDGILQGQRIWIWMMITLDHMQFLAMRVAKRIEPALVIQSDCVDDKIIALPPANGIAHPSGFEVLGVTPSVGPDLAPHALVLEEHKNAVRSLHDLKRLGPDQNSRDTGRIAVQDGIVRLDGCLRAVAGLRDIVPSLGPGSHIRGFCARATIKSLIWNSPNEEFIHAGQVVSRKRDRFLVGRRR